ncbi:unnamed protein product [Symbiodinium natans]|uniref:Uncharacterized protein n=1 Tax=Symbiodinium natans TaxID=878477 RepID=A0A812IEA5_9DINO|nr:unnamed protein product [Symbiodinium natans]
MGATGSFFHLPALRKLQLEDLKDRRMAERFISQARLIRRGRAGKTVMVEELMSANQSLHDDLIRLKDEQRLRGFRETEGMQDDMDVGTMDLQNDGEEGSGGELQSRVAALEAERRQLQKELRASQDKVLQQ